MAFMEYVRGEIEFSDWKFDDDEKLNSIISESAAEAIQQTLDNYPPYLSMPFHWYWGENHTDVRDGPTVVDPLTIDLSMPLGTEEDQPSYRVNLSDLFVEAIELHRPGGKESEYAIDNEDKQRLLQFVNSLRLLADSLETRINSGVPLEPRE